MPVPANVIPYLHTLGLKQISPFRFKVAISASPKHLAPTPTGVTCILSHPGPATRNLPMRP
jgi:hypothetical protein